MVTRRKDKREREKVDRIEQSERPAKHDLFTAYIMYTPVPKHASVIH
jgi:hypothetical protein